MVTYGHLFSVKTHLSTRNHTLQKINLNFLKPHLKIDDPKENNFNIEKNKKKIVVKTEN